MTDAELAALFHSTYEQLAPDFGYKTREASAVPWERVPENNRRLMVAVAGAVQWRIESEAQAVRQEVKRLGEVIDEYKEVIDLHHADFRRIKEWCKSGLYPRPSLEATEHALREIDGIVR